MNDEPTKSLGDDKYDTTPGITAILERINQVRDELLEQMNQNDSAILDLIGEVRAKMLTRFNDIEGQVRLTNHKVDVVMEELFNTKVQVRDVQSRVDELERKAT